MAHSAVGCVCMPCLTPRARRVVMSNIFQWQLHGDGKTLQPGEVVEPDDV